MNRLKFNYKGFKGLININTLSPNGKYYYKIQTPYSINMSNFGAAIAFYDTNKTILYHRNDSLAHWLEPCKVIEFVKWSRQGNMAFFYEYKRDVIYHIVFLDFIEMVLYRLNIQEDSQYHIFKSLDLADKQYDEIVVKKTLLSYGITKSKLFKDQIIKPTISDLIFKKTKWHPKV